MLVCLSLSPVDDLYNICPIRFIWHLFAITRSSQVMNKIHLASFCNNSIITGNEASYKSAALTSEQKLHCATTAPENISSEFYGTLWSWTSKHAAYDCYRIRVTEYDDRYHVFSTCCQGFRGIQIFNRLMLLPAQNLSILAGDFLEFDQASDNFVHVLNLSKNYHFWPCGCQKDVGIDTSTNALAYSWLMESILTLCNNQRLLCT